MCRTPLHVAVGTRADLSVIQLLADAYPAACSVQDEDGKTPLHLACDSSCELFDGDREKLPHDPPSIGVVFVLIRAYPWSVPLEDNDGTSSLEYAILSDSPIEVVKFLQHVTRIQCEKQNQQVMYSKTIRDESTPPPL
jgi:ankyrin repeat protein